MTENGKERNLLLVDDEPNILRALARVLRRDGYTIFTAQSGNEGLALLKQHGFGVIVSDQRMPEMSGTEFLSRVKEIYPDTVRIVLSGYTELGTITDAINRGAIYKFLTKPWDDDLIRENIRAAFTQYEMVEENRKLRTLLHAHYGDDVANAISGAAMGSNNPHAVITDLFERLPLALIVVKNDAIQHCNAVSRRLLHIPETAPDLKGHRIPESLQHLLRQSNLPGTHQNELRAVGRWELCDVYIGKLSDSVDELVLMLITDSDISNHGTK